MHGWMKVCVGLFLLYATGLFASVHCTKLLQHQQWWVQFSDR